MATVYDFSEDIDSTETLEFESQTHWYNTQKKFNKKREFWRAVIYALTRPDDYKPILLEKALKEKAYCEMFLNEIADYGENVGWVKPRTKSTKQPKE